MTGRERCGVLVLLWACAACGDGATPALDSDGDGLSDADERALGTNPEQIDSDLDGVPDYSDDIDGDGVSNADEIAAGTTMPPERSSTPPRDGAAGAPADGDEPNDEEGSDGDEAEPPGGDETPSETPADEDPGDAPGETPDETPDEPDLCAELRTLCGAGDTGACEKLELQSNCLPPSDLPPSCDNLWALCAKNQARACAAFLDRCDLPGCGDLEAGCAGGSEPLCTLHARECGDSSGPGDGEEPAYCPDLRQACENGSEEACALVESDCTVELDCDALEAQCKEAGGVGEACEQLAAHCG